VFYTALRPTTINVEYRIISCPATIFAFAVNVHNGERGKHTSNECIWKIRTDDIVISTSFNIRQGTIARRTYTTVRTLHFKTYVMSACKMSAQIWWGIFNLYLPKTLWGTASNSDIEILHRYQKRSSEQQ
jgi:hypothetical protein